MLLAIHLLNSENTAEVSLTENVAPTVNETLTVNGSNEAVVTFSEVVKAADFDGDNKTLEGITVKVDGSVVAPTLEVASDKLVVKFTSEIALDAKVTVEFKDAELTDSNNNAIKDAIASN